MVKASGIKVQKPEKSMFRTNAICVLRQNPGADEAPFFVGITGALIL